MTPPSRRAWLLRWRSGQRKTIYLGALLLGLAVFLALIYLQKIWSDYEGQTPGHPPAFGDFFALWSYAKIAAVHPVAELYDPVALHARQVALGMAPSEQNPFPYPPIFMLFLRPISFLPYEAAYIAWTIGTLALFIWVIVGTCSRLPLCVFGGVVSPVTVIAITSGQSGFLAAALVTAGLRLAGSRPILSGILVGMLGYKPQIGLLVPIALAAAGLWRVFGAACLTIIGLSVTATVAFGTAVWPAWISMLPAYTRWFDTVRRLLRFKPTVIANLDMAGVALPIAEVIQAVVAVVVASLVWGCFRRTPGRLAIAALLVGTFLATPHAFVYDLPMITAAMALFIEAKMEDNAEFTLAEIAILILAFIFPSLMVTDLITLPVSAVPLLLLFGMILRLEKQLTPPKGLSGINRSV
jgi:Glycosyltransferase family 87